MRKTKQKTMKQKTTKRKRFAAVFMASLVCMTGIDVGALRVPSVTEIVADETVSQTEAGTVEEQTVAMAGQQAELALTTVEMSESPSETLPSVQSSELETAEQTQVQSEVQPETQETTAEVSEIQYETQAEAQENTQETVLEGESTQELSSEESNYTQEQISEEQISEEQSLEEQSSEEETSEESNSEEESETLLSMQNGEEDGILLFSGSTLYGARKNGAGYDPVTEPNTDKWPYTYTLENLLNGYNVISFGDTNMSIHCMGGVLVQGNYTSTGSGLADGKNIPPSYVKGTFAGESCIYNSRGSSTNGAFYLGSSNALEMCGGYPYVKINGQGGIGDNTAAIYVNDNYFDFAQARAVVEQEAAGILLAGSTVVTPNEYGVITVNAGTTVTINSLVGVSEINIVGQDNSQSNTIINILQGGSVALPKEHINGAQPSVSEQTDGTAIVWNIPNATNVSIPAWNWVGHVLAPNAQVSQETGNYNGTIIGQTVLLKSEGHMYPYKGPGFVPTSNDFHVTKLLDNQAPEANQKFSFTLSRVDQPEGAETFVERTAQNVGSQVSFGTVHYNVAGVYVYQMKETSVTNGAYTCDTTVYYAYVNVIANQIDGKTVLSIESIRYYQAIDGKEMVPVESDGITFYNQTVQPTLTQRSVTKRWNDEADNDGKRPASIRVQLYADGEPYGAKVELNEANSWTYTWSDLPEKNGEHVISYTVDEVTVPDGYEKTIEMIENEFIIFNTHDLEQTERSVVKVWNDSSNQDGLRPESISVQLYADGEPYGAEVELNETNDWSYTWTGLPEKKAGDYIVYSVEEVEVPEGYTVAYDLESVEKEFIITNTHMPEQTERSVVKVWDDGNNQDGLRPESIIVQLYADGEPYGAEVELTEKNQWSYTWTGLPEKKAGDYIVYSVEEVEVPEGYTVAYDLESVEKEFTITNIHTPAQTERSVVKVWDDSNNQDGLRPESIIVQLYANGTPLGDTIELSAANHWRYIWTKLDKYEAGTEIIYTVKEIEVPESYEVAYEDEGTITTITNSYTPKQIEKTVRKVWKDNNNQNGLRPESILVQLYANGQKCGNPVELKEENNWMYTWTGLAEKDAGQTIAYTVEEIDVPTGYAVSYDNKNIQSEKDSEPEIEENNSNEMIITNTTTDFKVNKISAQDGHELYNTILSIYEVMPDGEISKTKVDTWTSKVNEVHNFGLKLVQGKTYILREEKATYGYKTLPGDIEFTVNEDGSINIISGLDWVCENGTPVIERIVNDNGEAIYLIRNTRNETEEEETEPETSTDPQESQSTTPEETSEIETTSEETSEETTPQETTSEETSEETTPEESSVPEETTPEESTTSEESTTPAPEEESSMPDTSTPAGSTSPTTSPTTESTTVPTTETPSTTSNQPTTPTTPAPTAPTSPRTVILGIEDMSSTLGMAMAAFGVIMLAAVAWLYVRSKKA